MSQKTSSQQHTNGSQDFIFEEVKERVAGQLTQADGLDSKANNILVAASALLVAGLVLQGALLTLQTSPHLTLNFTYTRVGLTVLLVMYAITMLAAIWGGFWIRSFKQIPEPEPFVEQYLSRSVEETKSEVIETQILAYQMNQKILKSKGLAIRVASFGFCLEVVGLIVLVLLQIF